MARRRLGRGPWIAGALIAFVAVDVALAGFALAPHPAADAGTLPSVPPTFSFTPSASPAASQSPVTAAPSDSVAPSDSAAPTASASPSPSASPTASATPSAAPVPTATSTAAPLTGFASSSVGYRATPGSCSGTDTSTDSVVQLTTDGGATWRTVNPTDIRIRAVEQIVVVDDSHVDLLARYGDSCTLSDVSTYTQGEFWQVYPDRTSQFPSQ